MKWLQSCLIIIENHSLIIRTRVRFKRLAVNLTLMSIKGVNDNASVMRMNDYGIGDVVYAVLNSLGGSIDGLKKLMKLLFLVQYDIRGRRVIKHLYGGKPITRTEFYLWSFGPMADEVYDTIDELENEGVITVVTSDLPFTISIGKRIPINLPDPVLAWVKEVVRDYGSLKGWELEKHVKELLDLTIEEKRNYYMGWPVDKYLTKEGFSLEERDLANGWAKE